LEALEPHRAGFTLQTLWSNQALYAWDSLLALKTLNALVAFSALNALDSLGALRTGKADFTLRALRTSITFVTL
jgi:hypothetical protein